MFPEIKESIDYYNPKKIWLEVENQIRPMSFPWQVVKRNYFFNIKKESRLP